MHKFIISFVMVLMAVSGFCQAETVVFQQGQPDSFYPKGYKGLSDGTISEAHPESNYGLNYSLFSGEDGNGKKSVVLMRWDITKAGEIFDASKYRIICAELEMSAWYNRNAASRRYGLFELKNGNAGWIEGSGANKHEPAVNAPAWKFKAYPNTKWQGGNNILSAAKKEPFAVLQTDSDSSSMLPRRLPRVSLPLKMVRSWAENPDKNSGFIIAPLAEEKNSGTLFVSGNHPPKDKYKWDGYRPRLIITYIKKQIRQDASIPKGHLMHDGQSNLRIIVKPNNSDAIIENAVLEFANHWEKLTGRKLAAISEKYYTAEMGPCISIGRTELSKKVATQSELKKLGQEGLLIDSAGGNVFILGNTSKGTLYGVYEYLEDLGIRWLTKDVTHFPETKNIKLPERKTFVPKFWYRETLWNSSSYDLKWAARTRQNGQWTRLPLPFGGYYKTYPNDAHSIRHLVPKTLRRLHPDWFALKKVPLAIRAKTEEYCLTNPEFREYLLNGFRKALKKNPDVQQIWVGQTDGTSDGCYCKKCTAERVAHGGKDRWAANMLGLLNYLGPKIKKEFPNVRLRTLAYSYYRVPPENMKAASDNITFMVCGPGANWMVASSPENQKFYKKTVANWRKTGASVMLWSYAGSNYGFWWPFPSWYFIGDNIIQAYNSGVDAMFMQGTSGNYGSGMGELCAFVSARMLWDPTRNGRDEIRDFTDLYYGPAGKYIRQYMEKFYDEVKQKKLGTHHGWGDPKAWKKWVSQDIVDYGNECFEKALEATRDNPVFYKRVEAAWLPLLWARIHLGLEKFENKSQVMSPKSTYTKQNLKDDAELFIRIMKDNGYTAWREMHKPFDPDTHIRNKVRHVVSDSKTIKISNKFLQVEIAPLLGGRVIKWKVKGVGRNFFQPPTDLLDGFPYCGGYEELSSFAFGGASSLVDFKVVSKTAQRCVMQAAIGKNLQATRTVEIAGRKLKIRSEYRNVTDKPVEIHLRSRPLFVSEMFESASYKLPHKGGEVELVDMWAGRNYAEFDYLVKDLKGNSIVFENVGPAKGKLKFSYGQQGLESVYVYWANKKSGRPDGVTVELWKQNRKLKPRESEILSQTFEYIP